MANGTLLMPQFQIFTLCNSYLCYIADYYSYFIALILPFLVICDSKILSKKIVSTRNDFFQAEQLFSELALDVTAPKGKYKCVAICEYI
jgi:hypothetical protein